MIEIVMVIFLTLTILFVVYDILLFSQRVKNNSDNRLELIQNGRIILDRLSRELRQTPSLVTELPATKNEVGFPPVSQIEFQDGHDTAQIQYIKYFVDNFLLKRQLIGYYFPDEPENYVYAGTQDEFGNPPEEDILDERTIAEYLSNLEIYGNKVVYLEIYLNKNQVEEHYYTGVWGRNTRE